MKFKNLKNELELLLDDSKELGKLASLEALQDKLEEKKAKYTRKLKKGIGLSKRDSVEARLEDLQVMLKTVKSSIIDRDSDQTD